jgi:hypothetical protein
VVRSSPLAKGEITVRSGGTTVGYDFGTAATSRDRTARGARNSSTATCLGAYVRRALELGADGAAGSAMGTTQSRVARIE